MTPKERKVVELRIITLKQRIKWNREELIELVKVVKEEGKKK